MIKPYINHNGKGMVPINKQEFILKLERKKNYVAVPGFVLRDLNDFIKQMICLEKKLVMLFLIKQQPYLLIQN